MHVEREPSIHLDIPFYRQHYDFTCGPASLMMAMKYLDDDMRLGKDLEIDLWREGNLVAVWGTSRYGLAYSAAVRGFSARVTSNTGGLDFVDRFVPPLNDPDMQMLKDHFYERRTRCRKLGVRERQETITDKTICNALFSNHVPLVVTNSSFFIEDDLPHWVAVTGIDDKFMYFNNPMDAKPQKRKTGLPALQKFVGYRGAQSMVEIWKQ
ncbi:MAG: peptidase C39 family protein [Methanoregula sp.]|nr:peptidase C39 family protein [Methanoregula sp.]